MTNYSGPTGQDKLENQQADSRRHEIPEAESGQDDSGHDDTSGKDTDCTYGSINQPVKVSWRMLVRHVINYLNAMELSSNAYFCKPEDKAYSRNSFDSRSLLTIKAKNTKTIHIV